MTATEQNLLNALRSAVDMLKDCQRIVDTDTSEAIDTVIRYAERTIVKVK